MRSGERNLTVNPPAKLVVHQVSPKDRVAQAADILGRYVGDAAEVDRMAQGFAADLYAGAWPPDEDGRPARTLTKGDVVAWVEDDWDRHDITAARHQRDLKAHSAVRAKAENLEASESVVVIQDG